VREIEGSKGVTEMQRRKQEKACWRRQPSPFFSDSGDGVLLLQRERKSRG
jgi:hypothetical protein